MKKITRICICIVAFLLVMLQSGIAPAVSALDVDRECSLTLHYTRNQRGYSGLQIEIYRVADYLANGGYVATAQFAEYPVKIHGISSQKEWQDLTQTMVSYVEADGLEPTATTKTDASGTASFEKLKAGLYLVMGANAWNNEGRFKFMPFFVFLPTVGENGEADYDVEAIPKPTEITPISEYTVRKLWKGAGAAQNRVDSVFVDIMENGVRKISVELSEKNNWVYTWKTNDLESKWTVMEKEVPPGYTHTINYANGTFTITNTHPGKPGGNVPTGDTAMLWPYILGMCLSGAGLLALGFRRKRGEA